MSSVNNLIKESISILLEDMSNPYRTLEVNGRYFSLESLTVNYITKQIYTSNRDNIKGILLVDNEKIINNFKIEIGAERVDTSYVDRLFSSKQVDLGSDLQLKTITILSRRILAKNEKKTLGDKPCLYSSISNEEAKELIKLIIPREVDSENILLKSVLLSSNIICRLIYNLIIYYMIINNIHFKSEIFKNKFYKILVEGQLYININKNWYSERKI